jgi:hypothetical protein
LLVVSQYHDMLAKHWRSLEPLWVVSAFLGGVGDRARLPDAVRAGLGLLSAALEFASLRPEVLHARMIEVHKELWDLARVMLSLSESTTARLLLDHEALEKMEAAHGAGLRVLMESDWEALESAAWIEFESDMAPLESGELGPANPKAAALLCAAAKRGPGQMLPKNLRPRTLTDWTRLLVGVLRARAAEPASPVPATITTLTLRRLGAAALGRAALGQLSKALLRHDKGASTQSIAPLPQSSSRPSARPQIAFVVPQPMESATLQWVTPPTRGMVMVVEEAQIEDAAAPLDALFAWWPTKRPLVWESYRDQVPVLEAKPAIKRFAEGYQLLQGDDAIGPDGSTSTGLILAPASDGADQLLAALATRATAATQPR